MIKDKRFGYILAGATLLAILIFGAGQKVGFEQGASTALDTVTIMLEKANRKDTVSRVTMVGSDTVTYFLSAKTIRR